MRYLSVCSGIEAASVAWEPLGWTPEAFSEIEAFPAAVLTHHWPDVPNLGDFTTITPQPGHNINVLVGGTPCQGFSVAGLRGSLSDDRSNLCLSFVRLAHALRATGPLQYVVWENVPGVLSTDDNAFGCFLGGLSGADDAVLPSAKPPAGKSTDLWAWKRDKDTAREFHVAKWPDAGMVAGPRARLAWRVLDAQHHGLAQRRRRVFVVAGFGEDTDPASVLFEPRRMRGHSPESRKSRQGVTGTLNARASAGGGLGVAFGGSNSSPIEVATTLNAKGGVGRMDFESETLIAAPLTAARGAACSHDHTRETFIAIPILEVGKRTGSGGMGRNGCGIGDVGDPMFTLQAGAQHAVAFNAREDLCVYGDVAGSLGTSSPQAQAIAFSCKDHGADAGSIAPTLRAMGHSGSHANASGQLAVAVSLRGREGGATAELSGDVMPAMRTGGGGADKPHALTGFGVRRLTPTECERLQGFPDGHTLIPMSRATRTQIEGDLAAYLRRQRPNITDEEIRRLAADGPRYRALGNSMAVPVMRWIGKRIQETQMNSGKK